MIDTKKIKIAMIENNINVIEMSEKLNVNVNTVSRWINGNHLSSIEKFIEMLSILHLNIDDIKKD